LLHGTVRQMPLGNMRANGVRSLDDVVLVPIGGPTPAGAEAELFGTVG
jgi:hypothetical protein